MFEWNFVLLLWSIFFFGLSVGVWIAVGSVEQNFQNLGLYDQNY
jgi:hypothetical protein